MWTADRFPEVLLAEAPLGELAPAAADTSSDPYTHLRCDWVVELGAWREAHDKEGREVNASGVLAAQSLAHTWPGARRAILCYSVLPLGQSGDPWPAGWPTGVGLQLHITEGDEDHEIGQTLAATAPNAELFVYPGEAHYFAEHKPPRYSTDAPSTSSRRS
jgi:hypothetical protein